VKKILLFLLLLPIIFFIIFVVFLTISMMPTKGRRISHYDDPQKAFLVIDIQRDFTAPAARPPFPYEKAGELIAVLNELTGSAKQENVKVIYLRQEFSGLFGEIFSKIFCKGKGIKGNPGTGFDDRLLIVSDHVFTKPKGDAFSNPVFEAFLIEHQIDELYLSGLDAEFCVYHTAKGAVNRGYRVNILTDAILLLNEKKWDRVMEKYEKYGIILMSSQEFLMAIGVDSM
jgi:nicotinamidase/pyrazinamidase